MEGPLFIELDAQCNFSYLFPSRFYNSEPLTQRKNSACRKVFNFRNIPHVGLI